jgi:hypothetical protein
MNAQAQAQNQAQNNADQGTEGYFDLHVNMVGYLSRVRWVQPSKRQGTRKSDPFLSCCIAALHGSKGSANYTFFDLRVSGEEAIDLVTELERAVNENRKVLVSAKVGDIYPHIYERDVKDENGRKTGDRETAALIKGRLILLNSVKIDGELFYKRSTEVRDDQVSAQSAPDSEAFSNDGPDSSFGNEAGDNAGQDDAPQEQRQEQHVEQRQNRPAPAEATENAFRRSSTGSRQGGYRTSSYARA